MLVMQLVPISPPDRSGLQLTAGDASEDVE
jgi:hypothetical protein